jgi:drug/metabolite transporter (DMT)-like permease
MKTPSDSRGRAVIMLMCCTLLWAISFPTMKALTQAQQALLPQASSWFLSAWSTAWRFGLSALIMAAWTGRSMKGLTRLELEEGIGLGLVGAGGILLQMDGLSYTDASTSAFLTQCYAVIIPLWFGLVHKRWPAWSTTVSCVLVMIGVAVLSGIDLDHLRLGRGELETVLAALFFTGQILWLERPIYSQTNANRFSVVMFVVMTLAVLPVAWATNHHPDEWSRSLTAPAAWKFLLILIGFSTLGGYMLMNHWQKYVPATQAGLIYCLEPVFASGFAMFLPALFSQSAGIEYPNERLHANLLVGGGLITAANLFLQWHSRQEKQMG